MKKFKAIFIGVMILTLVIQVSAQKEGVTPLEKAERQTKWMAKQLVLTEDQTEKVETINIQFFTDLDKVQNSIPNQNERISKIKELRKKRVEDLKLILTPEQFEKLKSILKKKRTTN